MRTIPDKLPVTADECPHLNIWIEWRLGSTQTEIGRRTGLGQARISNIANGHTIPKRHLWAPLLRELAPLDEVNFFRMVKSAYDAQKEKRA